MNILPKALQNEEFFYSSTKTKTALIEELQKMFSKKSDDSFANLSGGFISETEFYVTKQAAVHYSGKRNFLWGKIASAKDEVKVDLIVKPVPHIYIEIFAPVIFGLIILAYVFFKLGRIDADILLYAVIIVLLYPLIALYQGQKEKISYGKVLQTPSSFMKFSLV
jgi:hypothetical protein